MPPTLLKCKNKIKELEMIFIKRVDVKQCLKIKVNNLQIRKPNSKIASGIYWYSVYIMPPPHTHTHTN